MWWYHSLSPTCLKLCQSPLCLHDLKHKHAHHLSFSKVSHLCHDGNFCLGYHWDILWQNDHTHCTCNIYSCPCYCLHRMRIWTKFQTCLCHCLYFAFCSCICFVNHSWIGNFPWNCFCFFHFYFWTYHDLRFCCHTLDYYHFSVI